jgi:predicted anti-sigma-YlaC factor YlaD
MNCPKVIRLLSPFQDGELAPDLELGVKQHLLKCPGCRAEWDGVQEVLGGLRRLPAPAADPFFPTRVMAGLRAAPAKKLHLLQAAAYALVFAAIFLSGFLLQLSSNSQAAAKIPTATYSAVLLEPQALGLMTVQDDTLALFSGSDHVEE